jgi:hypothetical protein
VRRAQIVLVLAVLAATCAAVLLVLNATTGGVVMAGVAAVLFAFASSVPPEDPA